MYRRVSLCNCIYASSIPGQRDEDATFLSLHQGAHHRLGLGLHLEKHSSVSVKHGTQAPFIASVTVSMRHL